jgi:hypothetical protein
MKGFTWESLLSTLKNFVLVWTFQFSGAYLFFSAFFPPVLAFAPPWAYDDLRVVHAASLHKTAPVVWTDLIQRKGCKEEGKRSRRGNGYGRLAGSERSGEPNDFVQS